MKVETIHLCSEFNTVFLGCKSYIASGFLAFIYKLAILFLATWITQPQPSCTCISKDFLLVGTL